jgi:hypothetical protein
MALKGLLVVAALLAASQLLACSGSQSNAPPPPHVSAAVTASAGGTVTLPGGAAVQIPPNALASDTVITIQQSDTAPAGTVGAAYDFGPSGTTFLQPVTITLPVPAGTTDALIWTKPDGAASYTSLPTTLSGDLASTPASHFSVYLVGPVDLNGTWAGQVDYSYTKANGASGTGSTMQAREVTQDVGHVTISIGTGNGHTATCIGTVTGAVLSTSCTLVNLDGTCTSHYQQSGTVSGDTWYLDTSYTWTGATCQNAGEAVLLLHSPLTKRTGPGRNIAGSYGRSTSYTMTGQGKTPYTGNNTGTAVRTQIPGSSLVHNDVTMANGTTHTCKSIVISDASYGSCYGFSADRTIRYDSVAEGSIIPGPPIEVDSVSTTTIIGDPNGYTSMSAQIKDVMQ